MKMLLITAALFFTPSAHAQDDEGCYNRLTQDVNCNVIDETDEVPVDLEDPMCVATHIGSSRSTGTSSVSSMTLQFTSCVSRL